MEMSTFIVKALVVSRRFQQGEGSGTIKLCEGFVDLSTFRIQVSIVTHTGVIKMPFTAIITSGNKQWEVPGSYRGTDATNIKLEFEEISLLEGNRKFSRM